MELPTVPWQRVAVLCFYAVLWGVGLYAAAWLLGGVLLPFVLAWLTVFLLQPLIRFLSKNSRMPKKIISFVCITAALVLVGFAVFWICDRLLYESGRLLHSVAENADSIIDGIFEKVNSLSDKVPIFRLFRDSEQLSSMVSGVVDGAVAALSAKIPNWIAAVIAALPRFVLFTVVLILAAYYIGADYSNLRAFFARQMSERCLQIAREVRASLTHTTFCYLRACLAMMGITFCELIIGFSILGIEYSFTIALFTAAVDILPVLGVGSVLVPWSIVLLIGGHYYRGFGLLIILGVCWTVRQVVEPHIVSSSIGLPPLATLAAMYAGFRLLGITGVLLFPILAMIIKSLNDSGTICLWKTK